VLADNFMDTMDITKGTYYHNLSLDSMCFLAGIDSPKDSISGADVSKTYYDVENGLQIISEYCKKDVKAVAELFCALQGKKSFLTDIVDKTDDVPRTEYSILEQLYHANELTQKIKEGLKQQIFGGGKKPTKVDKENFKKIILANYQQKNDKVAVKKQKEQEINEFIDKL